MFCFLVCTSWRFFRERTEQRKKTATNNTFGFSTISCWWCGSANRFRYCDSSDRYNCVIFCSHQQVVNWHDFNALSFCLETYSLPSSFFLCLCHSAARTWKFSNDSFHFLNYSDFIIHFFNHLESTHHFNCNYFST